MAEEKPYHHGNLKEALLDAGIALIREVGPHAFTLREAARRAGVSHNAPYRHFRDREDLLAAVAAQGFERLNASMHRAMKSGHNAEDRLRLAGRGYVQFALRWPEHIQVMFDLPASKHRSPAGEQAFRTLLDAVTAVQAEGGLPPGDPHAYAAVAWSAVHGLAKLVMGGHLPFAATEAVEFTSYVALAMGQGMANLPHPSGGTVRGAKRH